MLERNLVTGSMSVCLSVTRCSGSASKLMNLGSCGFHRRAAHGTLVLETNFHTLGHRDSCP